MSTRFDKKSIPLNFDFDDSRVVIEDQNGGSDFGQEAWFRKTGGLFGGDAMAGLDFRPALTSLQYLYATIPPIHCAMCGSCCVSPHMTSIEFKSLLGYLLNTWSLKEWAELLEQKPQFSDRFEGNLRCPLQEKNGNCKAYEARGLACRLEPSQAVDDHCNRPQSICKNTQKGDRVDLLKPEDVGRLVTQVCELSQTIQGPYDEPYFVDALNFQSWIALILDPNITQPEILKVRAAVVLPWDVDFLSPYYVNHTGLFKKFDVIEEFYAMADIRNQAGATDALKRLLSDFEETGTYFHGVAVEFGRALSIFT